MSENTTLTGYPSIDKPWLKYYPTEIINQPLPESSLYDRIKQCNSDNLNRIALNYYGVSTSYEKMFLAIDDTASALEQLGVKQGDNVTIIMINSPATIYLMFALNKIGAVANMVYGADTPAEIRQHIVDAESTIIFTLDIFQDKIQKIVSETSVSHVIVSGITDGMSIINRIGARIVKKIKPIPIPDDSRFITWKQFQSMSNGKSSTTHDADAPAFITYTGGTTGGSKGVILSNKAVIAVAQQYILGELELHRDSKWMQVLPLFIAYGVTCSLMIPLTVGMTLIVRIPMSDSIADLCKKFRPNHIMYSPAFWEAFADNNAPLDLSYLIAPITGGDTLHEKTETKIDSYLEKCGCSYKLMNGYGMTEVGAAVFVNYKDKYAFGSVGAPFVKNTVSAFDIETGKELTYGNVGELCIHTPSMMLGYLKNPEGTDHIIRKHDDGMSWVHSGDLGYISEDGFIYISGRIKRYVLSFYNGVAKKVFSLDIEKVMIKHPSVEKCAVVPIDDEKMNQVPVAFIILSDAEEESPELIESLHKYAEHNLEFVYRPIQYYFLSKYPLTKVGKVDYSKLEEMAKAYHFE